MLVVLNDDGCGRRVAQPRSLGTTSPRTLASEKVAHLLDENSESERGRTGTGIALDAPLQLADFAALPILFVQSRALRRTSPWNLVSVPAGFG